MRDCGTPFSCQSVKDWDDLNEWFKPIEKGRLTGWIFRGQQGNGKHDCWDMQTGLDKAFRKYQGEPSDKWPCIERAMIRSFQRTAHHHFSNCPGDGDVMEWLALMGHYGTPVRLLDWTYSFYVAVYLAVNDWDPARGYPEVWAIDAEWLGKLLTREFPDMEMIERIGRAGSSYWQRSRDEQNAVASYLIERKPKLQRGFVYNCTPLRENERIVAQQGTFLMQADITRPFKDNLLDLVSADKDSSGSFHRVVLSITGEERNDFLRRLLHMNIRQASLFPDFDGFAKSFQRHLAYPDLKGWLHD